MERLTEQNKIYQSCEFMEDGTADYFNKLAEYEDTELTPQNIICREDDIRLLQSQNKELKQEVNRLRDKYEICNQ